MGHPGSTTRNRRRPTVRIASTIGALLGLALAPVPALAYPSWSLQLDPNAGFGGWNVPRFTVTNTSATESITSLSITIGDGAYVYDFVALGWPWGQAAQVATETTTGATLQTPDRVNGGVVSTTIDWVFTDFGPGETLVFQADVDPASGAGWEDARTVLFANGAAPNAVVTVGFDDGNTIAATFPDADPSQGSFTLVPEARSGLLVVLGLGGLTLIGRPRGQSRS